MCICCLMHICCYSVAKLCLTLCDPMDCSTPGFPVHHQLLEFLKLMSIKSVMQSNHFILCRPLHLLPSNFPSIRVFPNESALHIRWPKYLSFSFTISPSNEYSGPISFRMDGLDLLVVQGTLKSLLQNHSSKASIFQHSTFFIVQLSHPYMTTYFALLKIAWFLFLLLGFFIWSWHKSFFQMCNLQIFSLSLGLSFHSLKCLLQSNLEKNFTKPLLFTSFLCLFILTVCHQ